jgi:hypothetical protein
MRGLKKVLDQYSERYGIQFFAAPGNHDPNRPVARSSDGMCLEAVTNHRR